MAVKDIYCKNCNSKLGSETLGKIRINANAVCYTEFQQNTETHIKCRHCSTLIKLKYVNSRVEQIIDNKTRTKKILTKAITPTSNKFI